MSDRFVLALMVFCHILDDYFLQGMTLGSLKQKSFWEKNAPDKMYKHDYLVALFMHSFSWAFMITLPLALTVNFDVGVPYAVFLVANTVVHFIVDDLKANKHKMNLIIDQAIHMAQILISYTVWVMFVR